jgi:hypothetical protein
MKRIGYFMGCFVVLAVLVDFLSSNNVVYGDDFRDDPRGLMGVYFDALKNGDVETLITLLADPLLSSRRMLLEQNPAYPAYLRDYYKDSGMLVMGVRSTEDIHTQIVIAKISFEGDENPLLLQFLLKYTDEGWKIAEESGLP